MALAIFDSLPFSAEGVPFLYILIRISIKASEFMYSKKCLCTLYQSAWITTTKYQRLGGLMSEIYFLTVLEVGNLSQGASGLRFQGGLSSWLTESHVFAFPWSCKWRAGSLSLSFLIMPPILLDQDPTLLTSFNLNNLLKALSPNIVLFGGQSFNV